MHYPKIISLLQTHKANLLSEMARELAQSEALPMVIRRGDLVEFARVPYEIVVRYINGGDLQEWHNFVQYSSREALGENQSTAQSYKAVTELCFRTVKEFIERELPGPQYQPERENFYQRLKGLETISLVTAVSTELKLRSERRDKHP
jgi:hypothetical protein